MRLRALGVAALGMLVMFAAVPVALASRDGGGSAAPDSLRGLSANVGLRFGTAIIPFDLDHPDYAALAAAQFSTVTPGNEMKWQVVEPTQGVFDRAGGDRLGQFAEGDGMPARGHTLG